MANDNIKISGVLIDRKGADCGDCGDCGHNLLFFNDLATQI